MSDTNNLFLFSELYMRREPQKRHTLYTKHVEKEGLHICLLLGTIISKNLHIHIPTKWFMPYGSLKKSSSIQFLSARYSKVSNHKSYPRDDDTKAFAKLILSAWKACSRRRLDVAVQWRHVVTEKSTIYIYVCVCKI